MKKHIAFGIFLLTLATLACRLSITPTPLPTVPPTITATVTITPIPTETPTPTATPTPPFTADSGPIFLKLQMYTIKRGWALTENQILLTYDGGLHWAQIPLPNQATNLSISANFISADIAYFFAPGTNGQPGKLFNTRDSGGTWQITETPFSSGKIYFVNDNSGFAAEIISTGNERMGLAIYQTLNRGETWDQVFNHTNPSAEPNLPAEGIKTGIAFIDPSNGFIGLRDQKNSVLLYHAQDSGRNWAKQELELPYLITQEDYQSTVLPAFFLNQNSTDGFLPVDFISSTSGESTRVFYRTNDSGATWQRGAEIPEGAAYNFLDAKNGWAWGKRGLYTTTDGAKTWQTSPTAFNRNERAYIISFVDLQNGWLITVDTKNALRTYRTTDGGATWTAIIS